MLTFFQYFVISTFHDFSRFMMYSIYKWSTAKDTHSYVRACEISAAFLMFSARHYSRRSNLTTYSPKIFKLGDFAGQIKELNMVSCLIIFDIYMGIVILKHVMLIRKMSYNYFPQIIY